MVDGSSIDHEKIGKMTKDASFDNSDIKAVLAAINHMFRSAARFDCDEEVFSNEIGQLGLPKEHVDAMVRCFKEKKISLRGALREDMISAPLLNSIDWRASFVLASFDPSVDQKPVRPITIHPTLHLQTIPATITAVLASAYTYLQTPLYSSQGAIAHLHIVVNDGGRERVVSFASGASV
jgi:hypothetical protein